VGRGVTGSVTFLVEGFGHVRMRRPLLCCGLMLHARMAAAAAAAVAAVAAAAAAVAAAAAAACCGRPRRVHCLGRCCCVAVCPHARCSTWRRRARHARSQIITLHLIFRLEARKRVPVRIWPSRATRPNRHVATRAFPASRAPTCRRADRQQHQKHAAREAHGSAGGEGPRPGRGVREVQTEVGRPRGGSSPWWSTLNLIIRQ
jgi:hypothetical protein